MLVGPQKQEWLLGVECSVWNRLLVVFPAHPTVKWMVSI